CAKAGATGIVIRLANRAILLRCRNRALAAMILSTLLKCRFSVLLSRDIVGRFRSAPPSRSKTDCECCSVPFRWCPSLVVPQLGMVLCGRAKIGRCPVLRGKGRLAHDPEKGCPDL